MVGCRPRTIVERTQLLEPDFDRMPGGISNRRTSRYFSLRLKRCWLYIQYVSRGEVFD